MSFLFCGKLPKGNSPKSVKEIITNLQQEVEEKHHNLFMALDSKEMVLKINLCSRRETAMPLGKRP
jgi:hypothetical protein